MTRLALLAVLMTAVAAGCGSDRASRGEGTVEVVTSIAPLADIVRNVGGRRVRVTMVVPRAADPHEWRPSERDLETLREAELVVLVGGEIDDWAVGTGAARELVLLPRVEPLGDDSHWWQDPVRVQKAAKEIRNELARADVDGAGYYEAASADYLARLRELDDDIRNCIRFLPAEIPRLAVQHDGFAYFVDRYGLPIVEPRDGLATVGRRLWADTLAPEGRDADSYLGAMSENTATIVEALGRGRDSCRPRP